MTEHTCEMPFQCQECEMVFSTNGDFEKHMTLHTGEIHMITNISEIHMTEHTDDMPFQCQICEKTFSTNQGLLKHKKIHTKENIYQCNFCEKTFLIECHQRLKRSKFHLVD